MFSPGVHTGGILHVIEVPDRDDIGVEVTVDSGKDNDLFKRTQLCTLRRGKDGHGVGLFVRILSKIVCVLVFVFTMRANRFIRSNLIPKIMIRCFSTSPSHFRRARRSPLFLISRPGYPCLAMTSEYLRSMHLVPSLFTLSTVLSSSGYGSNPYSSYCCGTQTAFSRVLLVTRSTFGLVMVRSSALSTPHLHLKSKRRMPRSGSQLMLTTRTIRLLLK